MVAANITAGDPDIEVLVGHVTNNRVEMLIVMPLWQELSINLHISKIV